MKISRVESWNGGRKEKINQSGKNFHFLILHIGYLFIYITKHVIYLYRHDYHLENDELSDFFFLSNLIAK